MIPSNRLHSLLEDGMALGTFCELPCAESIEIIGHSGWDFAVIDCEHGPIVSSMLPAMIRAAECSGVAAIVRVAENNAALIQQALDAGAAGVQVPQITSKAEAVLAVQAARFHPLGGRGFNPFVRAAEYSRQTPADFVSEANARTVLILQIESSAGIEALPEILETPGIDVIFIGPYDLSQSLGIPGDVDHPLVMDRGRKIIEQAKAKGVYTGVFANTAPAIRKWREAGARYLCYSVDTVHLMRSLRSSLDSLRVELRISDDR